VQACHTLEVGLLERQPSRLRRGKQRPLHRLTRFGWTRLSRWQMRDQAGTFRCPLDALLGLQPRQHASPWVTHQAVALATPLPYRQATSLLSSWLQASVDHRSLYRWVQAAGAQVVSEEDDLQQAVFSNGEIPPRDPQPREIVLTEVDGTFLRAQPEEAPHFEVRLGVLTTGKALVSLTSKHRRYRLLERLCYVGVETAHLLGQALHDCPAVSLRTASNHEILRSTQVQPHPGLRRGPSRVMKNRLARRSEPYMWWGGPPPTPPHIRILSRKQGFFITLLEGSSWETRLRPTRLA
jgi:hypothetical protein